MNRFLLGALEAAVNPGEFPAASQPLPRAGMLTNATGFVLIMGMWYTAAEQPLRLEAYYCKGIPGTHSPAHPALTGRFD